MSSRHKQRDPFRNRRESPVYTRYMGHIGDKPFFHSSSWSSATWIGEFSPSRAPQWWRDRGLTRSSINKRRRHAKRHGRK